MADEISQELANLAKSDLDVMILFLDGQKGLRTIQPFTDQEDLIKESARKTAGKAFVPSLSWSITLTFFLWRIIWLKTRSYRASILWSKKCEPLTTGMSRPRG